MACVSCLVPLVPRSVATLEQSTAHPINEVDDSLGIFSPEASCSRNPARGMDQRSNFQGGLGHGRIRNMEVIVEDCSR